MHRHLAHFPFHTVTLLQLWLSNMKLWLSICCNILFCFKNSYVQQVKLILAQPTTTNYKLYQKPFECSVRAEQCCLFTISSCLKRPIPDVNHRNVCSLKDKVWLNGTKWTNTHDTESGKRSHMVSCLHLYFFEMCLEPKLRSYA